MYKDSRTDNWGGYHDHNRDPRNYHFARSTRELGWGFYRSDVPAPEYVEGRYSISSFLMLFALLLLIAAVFPDVRTVFYAFCNLITDWWATFDKMTCPML